jgi:hypothetical protein
MSDINPYIEGRNKEIELNQRKKLVENDIEFIKRDLESKTKMLIESRKNHVEAYDKQIAELKASCTHKDENGNPATSLTHKDIMIPVEGGYKRHHFCELCGGKFEGAFIEVKVTPNQPIEYISYFDELKVDGMELFSDNLEFDPDFNSTDFLSTTMTYFNAIGLINDGMFGNKKRK